ncbi:MAG: CPBP family intramembrane glutamic endopeptidase [Rhodococcus sp. (in: high G+C Gram-positive bacteria)]|uniref:CPBP family intramembrane glutamic endopeptidase n=1 Tax=Rhodococcus sp. TaxID=1831 RepID=UPI003BB0CEB2
MSRGEAVVTAATALAWNNVALPQSGLGPRGRAIMGGVAGLTAVVIARRRGYTAHDLGLAASAVPSGLRHGALAAMVPAAAYAVAARVPALHARLAEGESRADFAEWVALHIPVGTVATEELLFRSVLSTMLSRAWPRSAATTAHALIFGLWHVRAARSAGDSVAGTVIATGVAAWVFEELRRRSGSVVAPALLHLSINVGGSIAAKAARTGSAKSANRGPVD